MLELILVSLVSILTSNAASAAMPSSAWVLADLALLQDVRATVVEGDSATRVGLALVTPEQEQALQERAHRQGKCGGFERLGEEWLKTPQSARAELERLQVRDLEVRAEAAQLAVRGEIRLEKKPEIERALTQVNEQNLKDWVLWFSSFPTRYNRGKDPNNFVLLLKDKIQALLAGQPVVAQVDLISHRSTPQKSVRLRIPGAVRPEETVVLGAHLDSINQGWSDTRAPGADDNASGSSNLLEAARILLAGTQPERSIEFFWYAGEESGLLGSAEIAADYKAKGRKVVAVLQLDMTLFPGDGEFVLGSMTDFTSPWLRSFFVELNRIYIGAKIIDDKCGYGCSDHASWHRQGYPALMPFEASFDRMFGDLHTAKDVLDGRMSLKHSAMFSRIALALALELGNSN